MVQIKANSSRLMRYSTIFNAINRALSVYDLIANPGKRGMAIKTIQKKIRVLYQDSSGKNKISKITDDIINNFINQITSELVDNSKKK